MRNGPISRWHRQGTWVTVCRTRPGWKAARDPRHRRLRLRRPAVNPVRVGTGISFQLLESLAAGFLMSARRLAHEGWKATMAGRCRRARRRPGSYGLRHRGGACRRPMAAALAANGRQLAEDWNVRKTAALRTVLQGLTGHHEHAVSPQRSSAVVPLSASGTSVKRNRN